jgi:Zn-finger protein
MSYRFFQNRSCEYFPCKDNLSLNCLFCFCPLFHMKDCGGIFTVLENGWKDCSKCMLPHSDSGYDHIIRKLKEKPPTLS